jgi:hypothetical protein
MLIIGCVMNRCRHIWELAVDAEFIHWCESKNGKEYWDKFAKETNGMNMFQFFNYCSIKDGKTE